MTNKEEEKSDKTNLIPPTQFIIEIYKAPINHTSILFDNILK